jgi:AcrR family transcriptional regulator
VAPAEKFERRAAILRAAEDLLRANPSGEFAVDELAKRAGLAKGTVYLYFGTREEVLLQVHLARLHRLFDALEKALAAPRGEPAQSAARATLGFLRAHPEFLPLAINCRGMLESKIGAQAALEFKVALGARLAPLGARLEALNPGLARGDGIALLMCSYALMLGLWQLTDPPACLRDAMALPEMAMFRVDFEEQLAAGLLALWAGTVGAQGGVR